MDDVNRGVIVGQVIDEDGTGLPDSLVSLNFVRAHTARDRLSIRLINGTTDPNPFTRTNGSGIFALPFYWNPIEAGQLESRPPCELVVQIRKPIRNNGNGAHTEGSTLRPLRHRTNMIMDVDLAKVMAGRMPDLSGGGGTAKTMLKLGIKLLRNIRLPNMFLNIGKPTPELYCIFAATLIVVPKETSQLRTIPTLKPRKIGTTRLRELRSGRQL